MTEEHADETAAQSSGAAEKVASESPALSDSPASDLPLSSSPAASGTSAAAAPVPAALALLYAATILVSAFLLFQVQPLISKFILPWFGGSPAVWTTAMLSFQTLLFGGYAYAHLAQRRLPAGGQALFHLAVLAACLALLPIAPNARWKPVDASDPTWRIIALLTATVGLPYFLLSTTGPLVQAWFARAYPGRSPYRLYALSNLGSLAALVSYPFLVEPLLRAPTQAWAWSCGFVGFAALAGGAAVANWRVSRPAAPRAARRAELSRRAPASTPSLWRRVLWLALPAFASTALLATTNHVCQDVAVIPFLWVAPLGLYLVTFIITFDHERWYSRRWAAPTLMLLSLAAAALNDPPVSVGFVGELVVYFGTMFVLCLVCHGELVRLRPAAEHLTAFYLCIAAGGALGGIFVSLLAPLLFQTYLEWKLVVVGGYALGAGLLLRGLTRAVAVGQQAPLPSRTGALAARPLSLARMGLAGLGLAGLGLAGLGLAGMGLAGLALALRYEDYLSDTVLATPMSRLYNEGYRCETRAVERNFYGVVTVVERFGADARHHDFVMFNGQIPHGVQLAEPEFRREAIAYYSPPTGVARACRFYQQQRPGLRIGVIGLGVGTLATFARPGDAMTFFEINPAVERLALRYFTNLHDCRGRAEVWLGDGRLSLERPSANSSVIEQPGADQRTSARPGAEQPNAEHPNAEQPNAAQPAPDQPNSESFDLLVLDAFSGDAIPSHLLTKEAFDIYLRRLQPDGAVVVHISNKYLKLLPVVRGLAQHNRLRLARVLTYGDDDLIYRADWTILTRSAALIEAAAQDAEVEDYSTADGPAPPPDADRPWSVLWTDDHNDLFEILR